MKLHKPAMSKAFYRATWKRLYPIMDDSAFFAMKRWNNAVMAQRRNK